MSDGITRKPQGAAASSTTEKVLRLIDALAQAGRAMSLAELAAELDMPKATAHRLCAQLSDWGYLARDLNERSYIVGPKLRQLSLNTINHDSVRGLRHLVLAQLVEEVGETCNFTTLDGACVLYLDRVEAPWPWRLMLESGTRVPLHCTASGKLFLGTLPATRREALLSQIELTRMTPNTLCTQQDLRQACEQIHRDGYAIDREEFIPGLIAVAVPVTDSQGHVRAALALHGPTMRLSLEQALSRLPALRNAATRMRNLL